ncbi:two-component system sensor histidine kinase YesM [Neobacillus niacini]|uniref:cache domain-containing sensor histidine kinase n=1 Tax=Neobacillus niacini TaxID=86668 RepID=UPI00277F4C37|nr:sensor histidine kinase [Neobacillus niacini]MDQ1000924.1 two-component system sensor histidine kinase YesM [Neobacillus niacini]
MAKIMRLIDSPIKRKIILLALFSALIPLLVIGPFTFIYFSKVIENKVSTTIDNFLTIVDWNINAFASNVENLSNNIFLSNEIQSYLTYKKTDAKLYRLETSSLENLNNITVVNSPYINAIYVGNENHGFLKVNRGERNLKSDIYQAVKKSNIYPRLLHSQWQGEWLNGSNLELVKDSNQSLLYGRNIRDLGTKEQNGFVLIDLDRSYFENMFKNSNPPGDILILDVDKILFSSSNRFSSSQVAKIIQGREKSGTFKKVMNGTQYIINYHTNKTTNWDVVSIIPYENIVREVNQLRLVTISLLVIALIISLIIALFITRRITNQLSLLRMVTEKMEKRETVLGIHFNNEDELGVIGNRIVHLYNWNNDLTKRLYKSQIKEKEAELLALQSHINPHFLYNTLNTIFWMAEKVKEKQIAKIAINLSKIFKLTLNDGNHITSVKNEMDQVKSYLDIQNIRFDHKIHYTITIEPEIMEENIIKLLLQPIVENSVYHGLEHQENGTIMIEGTKVEEGLLFIIHDTGKGFDMNVVDINKKGYALKNINERLKLYYGKEYGLKIESELGKGTTVYLKVGLKNDEIIHDNL